MFIFVYQSIVSRQDSLRRIYLCWNTFHLYANVSARLCLMNLKANQEILDFARYQTIVVPTPFARNCANIWVQVDTCVI